MLNPNHPNYLVSDDESIIMWKYKVRPHNRVYERNWKPLLHHIEILEDMQALTKRKYAKEILEDIHYQMGLVERKQKEKKFW